jgi:SAM-dependent methyltransferase
VQDVPLTGERTLPGIPHENYWFRRHEVAYQHVARLVARQTVLDIGCGEGYGTALLAERTKTLFGVDYDAATIRHASATYRDVAFGVANLAGLPVRDRTIDLAVTLQVIEHVWDHGEFLRECYRVLRPGGQLIITTPNRLTFTPGQTQPMNPFHVREFSATELCNLVQNTGFAIVEQAGIHAGRRVQHLDRKHDGLVAAQLAAPPENWVAALRADVASIRAADFTIVAAADRDVDTALDLVLIARRPT